MQAKCVHSLDLGLYVWRLCLFLLYLYKVIVYVRIHLQYNNIKQRDGVRITMHGVYRSVMSRSRQNLRSSTSVVLRTQDFSVTDSFSPWREKNVPITIHGWSHWMTLIHDPMILFKPTSIILYPIQEKVKESNSAESLPPSRKPSLGPALNCKA